MLACVLSLSAQTAEPQWGKVVKIKLKTQLMPIEYWAGDVDSIFFEVVDTAKHEPVQIPSIDLGLNSKLLWSTVNTTYNEETTFKFSQDFNDYIHAEFDEDWTLATTDNFKEMFEACDWERTDEGFLGTSKVNAGTILLPYTTADGKSYYWTSATTENFIRISYNEDEDAIELKSNDDLSANARNKALENNMAVRAVKKSSDDETTDPDPGKPTGKYKVPTAIDLGLSVKWANFNLGAEDVVDYGGYFGWGDVKDSLTFNDRSGLWFKEKINTGIAGDPEYDVVAKELGGHWRMPTAKEMQELMAYCTRKNEAYYNDSQISVCILTSTKNNAKLIIPLAGFKNSANPTVAKDINQFAYLWTDSAANLGNAYQCQVNGQLLEIKTGARNNFQSIRPVWDEKDEGDGNNDPEPVVTDPTDAIVAGSDKNEATGIIPQAAVDMGTSVKWARWNLGATEKTGVNSVGRYFSWGETTDKEEYTSETYTNKWNSAGEDGFYELEPADDAATQIWGGSWKMPTAGDVRDLINKCDITWSSQNGIKGLVFTSRTTKNSIFFPAGGYKQGKSVTNYDEEVTYWTNEVYDLGNNIQKKSWATSTEYYYNGDVTQTYGTWRYYGLLIRPVMK